MFIDDMNKEREREGGQQKLMASSVKAMATHEELSTTTTTRVYNSQLITDWQTVMQND